jgi:RecA-family ATPase
MIVADAGQEKGAERVASAIGGQWVGMPEGTPKNYDANDYALEYGHEELAALLATAQASESAFPTLQPITLDELENAKPSPDCIVEFLVYADIGYFIGPGAMGKTTLLIYILIHIVLGRDLFGLKVFKPGVVVLITAEDSRSILVARARLIMEALKLDARAVDKVLERLLIVDTSGIDFKLNEITGDVITISPNIDAIKRALSVAKPVAVIFDPAISFAVSESRINDSEQGLILAARAMRNEFNCAVVFIHHTGKQNAREQTVDQYSGRGGSAAADGSRMVFVLQSMTATQWLDETGETLLPGETALRMARPKLSYCPPQGDILIKRTGYLFEHVHQIANSKEAKLQREADQVLQLIVEEVRAGRYPTANNLVDAGTGIGRDRLRAIVRVLLNTHRVEYRNIPDAPGKGARQYLCHVEIQRTDGAPTKKGDKNGPKF